MKFHRIRRGAVAVALFILALCVSPAVLNAQTSTQGSIAGTVTDPSGAVVAGASVVITNTGTNAQIKTTTDGSGYFIAPLLEPGTYKVVIAAPGFAGYTASSVLVNVGQVTSLLPKLALASSQSEVVVSEQAPVMNLESPDFAGTLDIKALQDIPVNNRRWSALAMTTPSVVADSSGYGLVSIHGISTLLNNIEIDGADDNQAYYAEERGRTREAYSTSGSATREFAVNTGVYSAEYGRAAGGVITSVTKSGSNQLHGQAYFWDRESNWNAFNDYTTVYEQNPSTGAYAQQHIKPEDLRKIYGFTVGGALIKDKLFWIYTYDQHTHIFPAITGPNNPNSFYTLPTPFANLPSGLSNSTCVLSTGKWNTTSSVDTNYTLDAQACTLAAREYAAGNTAVNAGNAYSEGVTLYDNGISGLVTDEGNVGRAGYQEINTPKIDWQINDRMHASFLYHRLRWDAPGDVQTQAYADYGRDTMGNDFVKLDYGVAKLTDMITTNISNELLYQYGRELNDEGQQAFTPYTLNNLVGSGPFIPEVAVDTAVGMNIGSPYYSYRYHYPDERKWQIADTLYWSKGNHTLKFGVDMVHNYDLYNYLGGYGNGEFTENYLGNYFADLYFHTAGNVAPTCDANGSEDPTDSKVTSSVGTYPCYYEYEQTFGTSVYDISTLDSGVFAQDNWKFSPRLTLELGLRWDHETIPGPRPNLIAATGSFVPYAQLSNQPSDWINFGPRLGFSYDVYGGGSTVLRGGYGIYYGRITNGNILNVRLNTGSPAGQYNTIYYNSPSGSITQGPNFPNTYSNTGGTQQGLPSSYYMSNNLKLPEVHEFDLQLQQAVGRGTIFSLSYLGTMGRDLPNFLNMNLTNQQNVTITVSDASGKGRIPSGTVFTVPTYTAYGNTALFGSAATSFNSISELTSNINSAYHAMIAEVQNRTLHILQFDANYTWAHATDFAQGANATITTNNWYDPFSNPRINYGNSTWDIPNRFVAYALFNFPNLRTNSPLKWVANDWSLNDSFQMQSGLPYTPGLSGTNSKSAKGSDWNGAGGLTIIPGYVGYDSARYPRHIVDDLRLQKTIAYERYSLELIGDAFNLANHQNIDGLGTTSYKLASSGSLAGTLTYQGQTASPNNTFGVVTSSNNSGFLYTPRQIELTARFVF
jgi:hypothetical protein